MEDVPTPPASAETTPAPENTPAAKKPKKPGRWRRRLIVVTLILVAIAVLMRVVIVVALPPVMRNVAARFDLDVQYDRMHLYLLSGDVGFWNLRAVPKEGGEPLFSGEYIRASVSAMDLLRGRLVVWRAEVDGSEMLIERLENGRIPLLERFAPVLEPFASDRLKPQPGDAGSEGQIDLRPPFRIDALRLAAARAHIRDRAVSPPTDAVLELTLRLSDLAHPSKPTRLLVDVGLDPVVDSLRIEGTGDSTQHDATANLRVTMRGLHPPAMSAYLAQLGLRPAGDTINLSMSAALTLATVNPPSTPAGPPSPLKGSLVLQDIVAVVDGKPGAGLKKLEINVDSADGSHAKIGKVAVTGAHVRADRSAEGAVRALGFELAPELATPAKATEAPTTAPSAPFKWELAQLDISDARAAFHDDAVSPPANLSVALSRFTIKDFVDDPARRDAPVTIDGEITLPGVARTAKISASATPFATDKQAKITLAAEGIKLDALKPYLDALGIESQLKDATASCVILGDGKVDRSGQLALQGKVTDVRLVDGGADLLTFGGAVIDGLMLDPVNNRVRVNTIELSGPQLSVVKEQSGAVSSLGLRIHPPATQPAAKRIADVATPTTQPKVALAATTPTTQPTAKPLRVDIGKLAWKDIKVRLEDQSVTPPTAIELADAGVELANLSIDTSASAAAAAAPTTQPATFKAWLTAPGSAGSIVASGTIAPAPGKMSLDAQVNGSKMNLAVLAPYLKPMGIEPTLTDGTLELHAAADVAQTDAGLTASAVIDKLRYLEGTEELAGIDALKVTKLTLGEEIDLGVIEVTRPRAWVQRDADGSFVAGGVRVRLPLPPSEEPPTPAAPTIATIGTFQLKDGALRWTDRAVQPPVDTTARSSVSVRNLVVGKPAPAAQLNLVAAVEGILDGAEVEGTVSTAPGDLQAHLDISAQGVKQGALASYLPSGVTITLKDGQLRTRLDAVLRDLEGGGQSADVTVAKLDYRDSETSLLKFDAARLAVARLDLPRSLAIDEVSLTGLETSLASAPDGSTHLLGIALTKAPPPPEAAAPATQPAPAASAPATQPTAPASAGDVARAAAAAKKQLPDVTLKKLDLQAKHLTLTVADAPPLTLSDWRINNRKPIELLGPDPGSRPPMEIDIAGRVDTLADAVKLGIVTAPFAQRPSLVVDVDVSGIKGDGALAFAPEMKDQIDGSALTEGTFRAHFETALKLDRRSLADFEMVKGFDADVLLKGVEFRAVPDGPVLAGVDEVHSEGIRAEPRAGMYHAKAIEITKPIAHAYRDAEGIHAMGLLIKLPKTSDAPPADAIKSVAQTAAVEVEAKVPAVVAPAEPMKGEVRIDRILVSGIDVSVEDRTVDPPLRVPITGLDVDVRDFTTRALVEDRPVKFNVIANAGKVAVPRRKGNGGYDQRELFSQVVSSGKLSIYPQPRGWAKTAVNGFELGALESFLKPYGIDLHAGVFDATTELRFVDDGSIDTKSRFIFTDMKLAEAPNGPIQRTMKLSAPLDVVLALLQDPSGGITLPISVSVKDGGLKGVGGAAVGAVASVAATAMASAPIKAANSVTGIVGLGPKKKPRGAEPPIVLEFAAADAGFSEPSRQRLAALVERMRREKDLQVTAVHELGATDMTRAALLANPSPITAAALAGRVRERKNELVELRGQLAADARVQLASHVDSAPTLARLRGVSQEIASSDDALDRLYDLLRPGADRQADRRTRAACIDIGQQRLDAVQGAIKNSGIPAASDRIQVTRAQFAEETPAPAGRVLLTVRKVKR